MALSKQGSLRGCRWYRRVRREHLYQMARVRRERSHMGTRVGANRSDRSGGGTCVSRFGAHKSSRREIRDGGGRWWRCGGGSVDGRRWW